MAQRITLFFTTLLLSMCFALSSNVWSKTNEEREATIKSLEKKIAKIEKKSKKRSKSFSKKFDKYLQRLKFNGFASAGITSTDVEANHIIGINDTKNYQSEAVLALQANFRINDKTEAVLQLASRGTDRNNTEAEWAYISHAFTPNFTVRAGRLRVPYYVASEYIVVGYAYPWARPPIDIYNQAPFTSYYGIDSFANFEMFGWDHTIQVFNGTDLLDLEVATFYISLMYGAYFSTAKGPWSARIGRTVVSGTLEEELVLDAPAAILASSGFKDFKSGIPGLILSFDLSQLTAEQIAAFAGVDLSNDNDLFPLYLISELYNANQAQFNSDGSSGFSQDGFFNASDALASAFNLSGINVNFDNLGFSYDDGAWLALIEFTRLEFSGEFQAVYAHYATVGKRINTFMPFVHYAHSYTPNDNYFAKSIGHLLPDIINGLGFNINKQKTYSAGVRWDVGSGMAIKFQIDHMTDLEGTNGKFTTNPGNDADLFSLVVDVVF